MDYELCSLIINTIIAVTAILGIGLSFWSSISSNNNVKVQVRLQQQPYLKISERSNTTNQITIKNIGTGPALSIYKIVKQLEANQDILDNLVNIQPRHIGVLGVNEECLTSNMPVFTPSMYNSDPELIKSNKKIVWIEAYICSDSFKNIYIAECEVTNNGEIFNYNFNFSQRRLNQSQIKNIREKLKLNL